MSSPLESDQICVIIGASHAGVNCAFALRKEGWLGKIKLYDSGPHLPYHRPPLSKTMIFENEFKLNPIKGIESYKQACIELNLNCTITSIDREGHCVFLGKGEKQVYNKLVIATGASALIPPIKEIKFPEKFYVLRTATDVKNIREALNNTKRKRVIIIGGGYIGLETAASLTKLGASVTILERENRILKRVTSNILAEYFMNIHRQNNVEILCSKNVQTINYQGSHTIIYCSDQSQYTADLVIMGVGISVNEKIAMDAYLETKNGIIVSSQMQTSDSDIYAIGDCTSHFNEFYNQQLRLESVQNAVDQAKVAASNICGKSINYNPIPWFWSDQYDTKLQMVGLSTGYNEIVTRSEGDYKFSLWYFNNDKLLAVDAINHAKAYMLGTRWIKSEQILDKVKLANPSIELNQNNFNLE